MNWHKTLGSLLLAGALLFTPLTPAFAVSGEEPTAQNVQTEETQTAADTAAETSAEPAEEEIEQPDLDPQITLNAKASICVNAQTGQIIHSNNAEEKMYPASTTKVMTALLTLEHCKDLQEKVTMEESDFVDVNNGASTAGFVEGERVTIEDLLYGLLLPSGNEAANALARTVGGSIEGFADMMNAKAKELGCVNSHFINPNGLHNDDHYTCAYDLYLIAQAAMQYEEFQTIVNTAQHKIDATNKNEERIILTTNELIKSRYSPLYYDNCYGIKTGHTTPAGYCLVSYAKNSSGSLSYYSVVLGCDYDDALYTAKSFTDTKELFQWAFEKFTMQTATTAGTAVTECKVRLGKDKDSVTLVTDEDVSVLLPTDADPAQDLKVKIKTKDSYDAPIAKGDKLGTVSYYYHGTKLAKADLVALTDVERSQVLYYLDRIKNFIVSPLVMTILIVLIALFVLICLIRIRNRHRRRKRRRLQQKKRRSQQGETVKTYTPRSQQKRQLDIKKRSLDKGNGRKRR